MFSILGKCISANRSNKKRNITLIILGLDNAGKTTTVKDLRGESIDDVTPSLGFANVTLKFGKTTVTLFDVGGGPTIRDIWSSYYPDVHGIIYVVDSTDFERLKEVRDSLENVLTQTTLKGKPILILANKQDKEGALDESMITTQLELESLINKAQSICRLESCSAMLRKGKKGIDPSIKRGFRWLVTTIIDEWDELNGRVIQDMEAQKQRDAEARAAKAERVRKIKEERQRREEAGTKSENEEAQETEVNQSQKRMDEIAGAIADASLEFNKSLNGTGAYSNHSSESEGELASPGRVFGTPRTPRSSEPPCNAALFSVPNYGDSRQLPPLSNGGVLQSNLPPLSDVDDKSGKKKKKRKNKKNRLAPLESSEAGPILSVDQQSDNHESSHPVPMIWGTPPGERSLKFSERRMSSGVSEVPKLGSLVEEPENLSSRSPAPAHIDDPSGSPELQMVNTVQL